MHSIARTAIAMALVFTAITAFWFFAAADEAQPAGTERAFEIVEVATPTKESAIAAIHEVAQDQDITIYKVQAAPQDSFEARVLFAFVSDEGEFAASGGYEYAAPRMGGLATSVVPASSITTEDLRGTYVTDADAVQMGEVLSMLRDAQITAVDSTVDHASLLVYAVGQGNLAASFAVVVLALWLALAYSISRNRKVYALAELHGYRRSNRLRYGYVHATRAFGTAFGGLLVVGVPVALYLVGPERLIELGGLVLSGAVILYGCILLLVALCVWLQPPLRVVAVLKGERAAARNAVLGGVVQVIVLAIVLSTASAAMARVDAVRDTLADSARWTQSDELYALRLAVVGTRDDDQRTAPGLAAVIEDMESRGQVVLAHADEHVAGTGTASLIVNNGYLEQQVVLDDAGKQITRVPEAPGELTLLVSTSYAGDVSGLTQRVTEYVSEFTCMTGYADGEKSCDASVEVVRTQAGQDVFTYDGTAYLPAQMQDPSTLHDPVVLVAPATSGLISPLLYLSYASADDVLFTDPDGLDSALVSAGIRGDFQGIDNAADATMTSIALAQRELRMDAFGLALGAAVWLFATLIVTAVYCDRRQRAIFVEVIHGRSFASRHWRYLTGTAGLALGAIGIALATGGVTTRPRDVALVVLVGAAQLALQATAVRIYETRLRADFIKRG